MKAAYLHNNFVGHIFEPWCLAAERILHHPWNTNRLPNKTLLFGAHLATNRLHTLKGKDYVFFNFEPRGIEEAHIERFHELYGVHLIWDYSGSNCEVWEKEGATAYHVPTGYIPELKIVEDTKWEDRENDVLFYGTPSALRSEFIQMIPSDKSFIHYCGGRDRLAEVMGMSKFSINIPYDERRRIVEVVRIIESLVNGVVVLCYYDPLIYYPDWMFKHPGIKFFRDWIELGARIEQTKEVDKSWFDSTYIPLWGPGFQAALEKSVEYFEEREDEN